MGGTHPGAARFFIFYFKCIDIMYIGLYKIIMLTKEKEMNKELKNKCCHYFYFFDDKNWIEIDSAKAGRVVRQPKTIHGDLVELVKKHGVRFKTTDDDNGDDQLGYYWSEHGIDFEPLEYMEADRGHTMLYYKEDNKDWQVL